MKRKTITGIKNTITGEVINITPIVENLEALGFDISNSLVTGVRNELETQQPQLIKILKQPVIVFQMDYWKVLKIN